MASHELSQQTISLGKNSKNNQMNVSNYFQCFLSPMLLLVGFFFCFVFFGLVLFGLVLVCLVFFGFFCLFCFKYVTIQRNINAHGSFLFSFLFV